MICVCSAVENIDRRKAIRSTWGDSALLSAVGARLVFVVARIDPTRSPPGIRRRVVAEHRRQGDVVQADFVDSYVNLPTVLQIMDCCRYSTVLRTLFINIFTNYVFDNKFS